MNLDLRNVLIIVFPVKIISRDNASGISIIIAVATTHLRKTVTTI